MRRASRLRRPLQTERPHDLHLTEAHAGRITHKDKIKKAYTLYTDGDRKKRHIKPALGRMTLNEVNHKDVYNMLAAMTFGRTSVDVRTRPRDARA